MWTIKNPWHDEMDWLVSVVCLNHKNDPRERRRIGEEIGYLLGFADYTETRIMAKMGDDTKESTVFQFFYSFKSESSKQKFMALVRTNHHTNRDDDECQQFRVPIRTEIEDAEAISDVLPVDIARTAEVRATLVALLLKDRDKDAAQTVGVRD